MAVNPPEFYGRDILCMDDADPFLSDGEGLAILRQDLYHMITTDNILGPDGDGWGFDCRRLAGMPTNQLPGMQAILQEVIGRDDRVDRAVVLLSSVTTEGFADVLIDIAVYTAEGPFRLTKRVSELTLSDFEAAA